MIARMLQCDRRRLELALEGRLVEEQAEELAHHLQACKYCRLELEQLAANQECWDDLKHLSACDVVITPGDESRPGSSSSSAPISEGVTDQEGEESLDFLTPTDKPGLLGRLGDYEIESVIGRGGMGIVLKAHDPTLNRFVAIKVMVGHLATSAAARKRFAREAQAAAAVVHDHVIPIYAVDTTGQTPFLVMPYMGGGSLQDRLDERGVLEIKEALRIALQTTQGLAAAHAQGLIHRDIKPANILLENGVERVRITDFGLARAMDDASQTQSGFIAGTPQYMAPEQARGEPIDARADLFSLGTVMYAMFTGHSPFRAETTLAVLRRVCDDAARKMREINADVPHWLSEIIERLLAKSPASRLQTADEVAALLESWLAHLQQPTVIPRPKWPGLDHSHQLGRRSLVLGGLASAAAVGLLAWALWHPGLVGSRDPKSGWETNNAEAGRETWESDRAKLLQGTWKIMSVESADEELSIGDRFEFSSGNRLKVHKERRQTVTTLPATFRLHGSQDRSTIDITFDDGSTWLGHYEVGGGGGSGSGSGGGGGSGSGGGGGSGSGRGDRLRMSFGQPGGQRPTKLSSAGADWAFVLVELERQRW